jgi:hypothetical protein
MRDKLHEMWTKLILKNTKGHCYRMKAQFLIFSLIHSAHMVQLEIAVLQLPLP